MNTIWGMPVVEVDDDELLPGDIILVDWPKDGTLAKRIIAYVFHRAYKRERTSKVIRGEKTGRAIKKHEVTA